MGGRRGGFLGAGSIAVVATLVVGGMLAAGAGAAAKSEAGVSTKAVTVGLITSLTGFASSNFKDMPAGFNARIDAQNAAGGVNGRKIKVIVKDDQSSPGTNLTVSQDLIENENAFTVVNESPFAFGGIPYFVKNKIPTLGGGFDSNLYAKPGNEDLVSVLGNQGPVVGAAYTSSANVFKKLGATRLGALGYAISPSSSAAATNFIKYSAPAAGLKGVYLNNTVPFGSVDVGPLVLAMKNAGVDGVSLPLDQNTNFAVIAAAKQQGLVLKAAVLATGYGQNLLDQPVSKTVGPEVVLGAPGAPVELKTAATKKFQADLKKYQKVTGVPEFGHYEGYMAADLLIKGLQAAGKSPTRQAFLDGIHNMGTYDGAGLACQPIDVSLTNYGKTPPTLCSWTMQIKNGKFVPYPANGKPTKGTLIQSSVQGG
jgi:branched-chain amino acid transport system substrate-binding protein